MRHRFPVILIAALCGLIVGCSANGSPPNASAPTSGSPSSSAIASPAASAASPAASAASSTSVSPPPPVPVLGQSRGITAGYGSVRPSTISNGGDPTGIVTNVSWASWGGAQATGTGTGYYEAPSVPVSSAIKEQATIVAFDLGTCDGQYMYQAIEWYFPESGGSFQPASYLNICSWTYSAAS